MIYFVQHVPETLIVRNTLMVGEDRMQRKRPNIILITSDQHRWDCFGFGPRQARMPHLARLAKKGVKFENCTTANPLCQPARASILTGMLPYTHGVVDNGIDLDVEYGEQGFASTLAKMVTKLQSLAKHIFLRRLLSKLQERQNVSLAVSTMMKIGTGPIWDSNMSSLW